MTIRLPLLPEEKVEQRPDELDEAGVGTLATERGNLPLEAIDVHAEITGLVARTRLRQTFTNPFDEPLEATYIFPLPGRAAVNDFRMELDDHTVVGILKERETARADYDQAIAAGKRAAIAEEERPGVFTVRVGNLRAGERATVQLVLVGPLAYDDGEATYRFPLVVAPRYIPGEPLPDQPVGDGISVDTDIVPDASRITPPVLLPGFPNPVRLSISAELDPAGLRAGEPRSSLHTIVTEERDGGGHVLRVTPGERANRDFLLRFPVAEADVRTGLVVAADAPASGDAGTQDQGHSGTGGDATTGTNANADTSTGTISGDTSGVARRDEPEDAVAEGTFALTVVPPAGLAASARPRDVALVLDRSGSMQGWKIMAARRAAARIVDTLGDADRFTVLAFDHTVETPPGLPGETLVAGTDRNRYRAVEFLTNLDARGGTQMHPALSAALDRLAPAATRVTTGPPADQAGGERDRVLVLVTDGQIGNEDQVLRGLAPRLAGIRVFTVGIDTAVNAAFLERLAAQGGGACELVESEDRLDEAMDRIHRRVDSPALVGLRLQDRGLGLEAESVAPARLPDLFAGAPLIITGRWKGDRSGGAASEAGALTLVGQTADGQPWRATAQAVTAANGAALAPMWARARLRDLEDQYVTARDPSGELERRQVEISLRFGVLCRFTAFVAIHEQVVNEQGTLRRITQPVDAPAGWDMFAAPAMPTMTMAGVALSAAPSGPLPPAGLAGPLHAMERSARATGFRRGGTQAMPDGWADAGGILQPEAPESAPTGLEAVRDRARRLLVALDPSGGADSGAATRGDDKLRMLRALEAALDELVKAIRAAAAPAQVLRPLEAALKAVRGTMGAKRPAEDALQTTWRDGLAAIRAFVEGGPRSGGAAAPPPSGQRKAFWRRPSRR